MQLLPGLLTILFLCTASVRGQASAAPSAGTTNQLSRQQVEALIAEAGKTPPVWWNDVKLVYPPTLDLTWTVTNKPWNPQRNLGQYTWDIINPNPGKWREGVRLMHHVLTVNKDNKEKLAKTAAHLAGMYHNLLRDWARAAFWYRKTVQLSAYTEDYYAMELGECYWKLGNRDMCVDLIKDITDDETWQGSLIKLWADLGDLDRALKIAEAKAHDDMPDIAFRAAGDACRLAGKSDQAIAYYQKVIAAPKEWKGADKNIKRARASMEAIRLFDQLNLKRVPDGVYQHQIEAYAGPMTVAVTVQNARIQSVRVVQHKEKQFYTAIADTTTRIVEKQSVKGIDLTTGATITAEAIVNATAKALSQGMR